MSYSRQLPAYLTGTTWQTKALDYSRAALPDLAEGTSTAGKLDEARGLPSSYASNLVFGTPDKTTKTKTAATGSNIDWTGDAVVSSSTSLQFQDVNNFGIGGCGASSTGQILKGFDDWANAKYDFKGTLASFDGVWPTILAAANTPELTTEIVQAVKLQGNQYKGVDQPLNDDGSSIYKVGDTIPIKFTLYDANGKPVTNKPVTFTVQKVGNTISGTVRESSSSVAPYKTNLFTVDMGPTPKYHYEWGTKGQTQGTYELKFYIDSGKPTQELLSNGKSGTAGPYTVRVSLSTK
jgi:hypothetical protein